MGQVYTEAPQPRTPSNLSRLNAKTVAKRSKIQNVKDASMGSKEVCSKGLMAEEETLTVVFHRYVPAVSR